METLLYILFDISAIVFVVLMIYVIGRAIRFGENRPKLTKAASIFGIITGIISVLASIISVVFYKSGILRLVAAFFCLAFAFALKHIVRFFEEDYDKKHQIPVNPDESLYRFEFEKNNPDSFFDENARFNGKFKDFDDDD
ncbi:MAG: hypothetical protein ACI4JZ_09070 [Oscillospiraceae bacterium]